MNNLIHEEPQIHSWNLGAALRRHAIYTEFVAFSFQSSGPPLMGYAEKVDTIGAKLFGAFVRVYICA